MQKPAPVYVPAFVLHPERDTTYRHFEDASSHPFRVDTDGLPRVNAWWLAEAALAAYWPPDDAAVALGPSGLSWDYLREGSTHCYLTWMKDVVIVSFRGTEPDDWDDIATDLKFPRTSWTRGNVHGGFKAALDLFRPQLSSALGKVSSGRAVWFTGHSLGGALAMLAADRYAETRGVCTTGVPRVGDREFVTAFDRRFGARSLRYVNNADGISRLPPSVLGFEHVGQSRFISGKGQIADRLPAAPALFGIAAGSSFNDAIKSVVDSVEESVRQFPKVMLDHMPKAFAIWMWNDYDANG